MPKPEEGRDITVMQVIINGRKEQAAELTAAIQDLVSTYHTMGQVEGSLEVMAITVDLTLELGLK